MMPQHNPALQLSHQLPQVLLFAYFVEICVDIIYCHQHPPDMASTSRTSVSTPFMVLSSLVLTCPHLSQVVPALRPGVGLLAACADVTLLARSCQLRPGCCCATHRSDSTQGVISDSLGNTAFCGTLGTHTT